MLPLRIAQLTTAVLIVNGCASGSLPPCPAPCKERTQEVMVDMDGEEDLVHQALYGDDIAPPSVLEPPGDAYVTEGGVRTVLLSSGTGEVYARRKDRVTITFTGWTTRGERYDSSALRGGKETVEVGSLVPGLVEVVRMMVAGERRRIWIPATLAYGAAPPPDKPTGDIIVELELHDVLRTPDAQPREAPPAPADVAEAPADAKRTASGLAYKVLTKGKGKRKPTEFNVVLVHYTGWTPDGQMFDSSIPRGEPLELSVNGVIRGWTEALLLMVEGDKLRIWIPSNLAYGDQPERPGAPAGPLTFDVELVAIR